MSREFKLCKDPSCVETTYICRKCRSICCRHFYSINKELCGSCSIKDKEEDKKGMTRCENENCQLVILKSLVNVVDGKEYCITCFSQIELEKVE